MPIDLSKSETLKHVSEGKFKLEWGYTCKCNGTEHKAHWLLYLTHEDAEEFASLYIEPNYPNTWKVTPC